jgi:hypothetical protein
MALALVACQGRNAGGEPGTPGGGGTETGSPGMTTDTAPAGGMDTTAMDTAMTDTGTAGGADTTR